MPATEALRRAGRPRPGRKGAGGETPRQALRKQRVEEAVLIVACARRSEGKSWPPRCATSAGKVMDSRNASGCARQERGRSAPRFPSRTPSRSRRAACPPRREAAATAPSSSRACCAANAATSARAAQPLAVGMAAHDARRRARHVGEDAVERSAVPPRGRRRRRRRRRRATRAPARPQAREVLANAREPRARRCRARSARRRRARAGASSCRRARRRRRARACRRRASSSGAASCAPASCTAERALGEARQLASPAAAASTMMPAVADRRCAAIPAAREAREQRVARRRRARLTRSVSGGRSLPAARIASQCVRIVARARARSTSADATSARPASRAHRRVQRVALAQVAAQQRVDRAPSPAGRTSVAGRVDRAIDDGERRRARVVELIERDARRARASSGSASGLCASARASASSVPQWRSVPYASSCTSARAARARRRRRRRRARRAGVAPSSTRAHGARGLLLLDVHRRRQPRALEARAGRDGAAARRTRPRASACRPPAAPR